MGFSFRLSVNAFGWSNALGYQSDSKPEWYRSAAIGGEEVNVFSTSIQTSFVSLQLGKGGSSKTDENKK